MQLLPDISIFFFTLALFVCPCVCVQESQSSAQRGWASVSSTSSSWCLRKFWSCSSSSSQSGRRSEKLTFQRSYQTEVDVFAGLSQISSPHSSFKYAYPGCVGLDVCDLFYVCIPQLALLNPIENPNLELAIVMLIVPFFVNVSRPPKPASSTHWFSKETTKKDELRTNTCAVAGVIIKSVPEKNIGWYFECSCALSRP